MFIGALKLLAYKEKGIDLLPDRFCLLAPLRKLQLNPNLKNKKTRYVAVS